MLLCGDNVIMLSTTPSMRLCPYSRLNEQFAMLSRLVYYRSSAFELLLRRKWFHDHTVNFITMNRRRRNRLSTILADVFSKWRKINDCTMNAESSMHFLASYEVDGSNHSVTFNCMESEQCTWMSHVVDVKSFRRLNPLDPVMFSFFTALPMARSARITWQCLFRHRSFPVAPILR